MRSKISRERSSGVGEQALVVTEEDPQGLGQREDELTVGEGKEQLLIEVLREQQSSLVAA